MENNEKMMTGEESLRIISEMINKTKVDIRQGSFYFLFWGWLIFLCSMTEYILSSFTHVAKPWNVWLLTIPGVLFSILYGFITGRKTKVYTYAGSIYMWTWLGFLAVAVALYIIMAKNMQNVAPLILLLVSLPTFISGFIIKFRPLVIGGVIFWISALIAHFAGPSLAPLVTAVAMLSAYLIPGYLLKRKAAHDTI
jgi:hypothetical protein